ncbi:haloacid dehalogenase-like hydrolase protein [Rutstroemia sp. NJR-2017a BBW]|nr:haloacid dehalogenase-like hydrolase protein [Rutstroemia sp. NJR-2017a BBW]
MPHALLQVEILTTSPRMYPCLQKLKASKKYILAGLSNTPRSSMLSSLYVTLTSLLIPISLFLSLSNTHTHTNPLLPPQSAHVHLRKPSPEIYALTLNTLRNYITSHPSHPSHPSSPLHPSEILFLDDIGENLKAARELGMQTIKVPLGRSYEAVEELERITGLQLQGTHEKLPILPMVKGKEMEKGAKL